MKDFLSTLSSSQIIVTKQKLNKDKLVNKVVNEKVKEKTS